MDLYITGSENEIRAFLFGPDDIKVDASFDPIKLSNLGVFGQEQAAAPELLLIPQMVKIGKNGERLADDAAGHVAVLLPQYGLMFDVSVSKGSSWEDAKKVASKVTTCGFTDWRLPTDTELSLLIRRDLHKPAIDTKFFPTTPTDDWFWTATPHASAPGYAWGVLFGYGVVGLSRRYNDGFVRAVRRVPASQ